MRSTASITSAPSSPKPPPAGGGPAWRDTGSGDGGGGPPAAHPPPPPPPASPRTSTSPSRSALYPPLCHRHHRHGRPVATLASSAVAQGRRSWRGASNTTPSAMNFISPRITEASATSVRGLIFICGVVFWLKFRQTRVGTGGRARCRSRSARGPRPLDRGGGGGRVGAGGGGAAGRRQPLCADSTRSTHRRLPSRGDGGGSAVATAADPARAHPHPPLAAARGGRAPRRCSARAGALV